MPPLNDDSYVQADVSGKETETKAVVSTYVATLEGGTDDEKRKNLPIIKKEYLHGAVDYVNANLPSGVTRVDGYVIRPLLDEVCNEKIAALPEVVEGGE